MASPAPGRFGSSRVTILLAVGLAVGARLALPPMPGTASADAPPAATAPALSGAPPRAERPPRPRPKLPALLPARAGAAWPPPHRPTVDHGGALWPIAPQLAALRTGYSRSEAFGVAPAR